VINPEEYKACKGYIKDQWRKLTAKTVKNKKLIIGLPNAYICPSRDEFDKKMYYWDSYFIILGLLCDNKVTTAKGMAENLFYLFRTYGFIPQSNRFYHLGKSNPPLLTAIITELFPYVKSKTWLRKALKVAVGEYETVWTYGYRITPTGLSRYWEPTHTHEQAEDESGWDRTSRFFDRCLDITPVDLNCLLYKYELDIADFYSILKDFTQARYWKTKAVKRKKLINTCMWDSRRGFFFDLDYKQNKKTPAWSLAGFVPLWAGLADAEQAQRCANNLKYFEYPGGLVTTRRKYIRKGQRQWDYPIGWACLHWFVIKGLFDYGYREDAERIAEKWLNTCRKVFDKTGKFWEKYNVVKPGIGKVGRYPVQAGFGWSNGVFLKILEMLSDSGQR